MAVSDNVKSVSSNTVISVTAAVEVLGDTLVSDDVGHVVLRSIDREEALEVLLAESALIRVLHAAVGDKAGSERVRTGTNEPAASRAEPSKGVGGNGLVPAVLVVLIQDLNAVVGVLGVLLEVVQIHEVRHVHVVVVANGIVEVATGRAAVDLEEGVRAAETTGSTKEAKKVVVHVLGPATLRDGEEVASQNDTESGEQGGHVGCHAPNFANCSDILGELNLTLAFSVLRYYQVTYSGNSVAREVVVVGEGVESRAKTTNLTSVPVGSLELVLTVHYSS
jgi:hypothetical protein